MTESERGDGGRGPGKGREGEMDRRGFLRTIGVGVGGLAASGGVGRSLLNPGTLVAGGVPAVRSGRSPDVVVVGAGAFGGWTALRLREAGLRVTLVDMYGPGNARSTSGDETRGVRTGYRTREVWSAWASRAIEAWKDFDFGWGRELGVKLFHTTGDLALRAPDSPFIQETVPTWERLGIRHEVLDGEEVARRWPQLRPLEGEVGLYEPEAGVARSRLACEVVAEVFRRLGGETRTVRAVPGEGSGDRLRNLSLDGGEALHADRFVFALGPWFPKAFPGLMGDRMTLPMGYVCYYGTPPGDPRFTAPNLPSFNLPTATGWPDLPAGSRGFRIRASGGPAGDPDTSDRWVPEASLDVTRELLTERFPAMAEAPLLETRACHYEFSFTRDWLIDRHPEWENVWFAGEGNAESFKFGPILGGFIAGRVLDDDPHPELADRFRWDSDPPAGTAWG